MTFNFTLMLKVNPGYSGHLVISTENVPMDRNPYGLDYSSLNTHILF